MLVIFIIHFSKQIAIIGSVTCFDSMDMCIYMYCIHMFMFIYTHIHVNHMPTKVHIVKAMVFPVVMHRCESWTIKKVEHWGINSKLSSQKLFNLTVK